METIFQKVKRLGLKMSVQKAIGYKAAFNIAYRANSSYLNEGGIQEQFISFPHSKEYWYADPLIFTYNGETYVFMEAYNKKKKKGAIAYSLINESGISVPEIIIEESYHMSFPLVFEWDECIYMIPETEANDSINIYKCCNFPNKWILHQSIKTDIKIVDSIILDKSEERMQFLASTFDIKNVKLVKHILYYLNSDVEGKFSIEIQDEVSDCFDYVQRNAGQLISVNEKNILVSQRSTDAVYGYSLLFFYIKSINPFIYDKSNMIEIQPKDIKLNANVNILGVHTYSRNEKFELIDYEYLERY